MDEIVQQLSIRASIYSCSVMSQVIGIPRDTSCDVCIAWSRPVRPSWQLAAQLAWESPYVTRKQVSAHYRLCS